MAEDKNNIWWGPPRKFPERQDKRKVSWLELFYDLIYAAAISQLTHYLGQHTTWLELVYFTYLFTMLFWSWYNGSLYHDLHWSDGVRSRFLTFLQMLSIAVVAITLNSAFSGHQSFAIAFLLVECIITYLWWSTGHYDPSHKPLNKYYILNYSISIILFILSIFADEITAEVLWLIALVLNLSSGLLGIPKIMEIMKSRGDSFTPSASLIERFGSFTIIVLAETLFGIITGISLIAEKTFVVWYTFILGILIAFLLWSLYFDMIGDRRLKTGYRFFQLLYFLHIPLLASFGVVGACISLILAGKVNENTGVLMFGAAIAVILISISSLAGIMQQDEEESAFVTPVLRLLFITAAAILLVCGFSKYFSMPGLLTIITLLLAIPVVTGGKSWARYKMNKN